MNDKNKDLSRGKKQNSMLDNLLSRWDLNYNEFAAYLGIHRGHLWQYRTGKREFRLNMEQMHKLDKLLQKVGMRIIDLPLDWYRDIEQEDKAIESKFSAKEVTRV